VSTERSKPRTNPFVGPRPFLPGEPLFGRDREISALRNLLVAERIVALYSPSGAGKTSLLQAGLVPRLQESDFHVLPVIRVNQPPIAGNGSGPNRYLESTLRSLDEHLSGGEQRGATDLADLRLGEYLAKRPKSADAPETDLLIFDQFEEILTLDPTDGEAKTEFFTQVGEALRAEQRWALFSFREDHLAGLDRFLPFIPTRLATSFRLEFLSREAAVLAIQGTAGAGGVDFTKEAAEQLVTDLSRVRVQQPDRSFAERAGPDIEPVQLQVVCHRLWNQLSDDQDQIDLALVKVQGDVSEALGGFYAESVAMVAQKTGLPERDLRAWFDEHLITKQGIRGQVLWESTQSAGLNDEAIRELINTHLVRAESRRGATWLELAHDRLIDPVRANNDTWYQVNLSALQQQARLWQSQGRAPGFLLSGEALTQAEQWAANNQGSLTAIDRAFLEGSQDQRKLQDAERRDLEAAQRLAQEAQARQQAEEVARREAEQRVIEQELAAVGLRRRFLLAAGLGVLAVLAAVGAFWGFQQADEQRNRAEEQRGVAVAAAGTAEAERDRADHQANIARIRALAAQAPLQHDFGEDERGALLARQAYLFDQRSGNPLRDQVDGALRAALGPAHFSRILYGHHDEVISVASSPDGQTLASGSADGTVCLWDMANLTAPVILGDHDGPVTAVAFSPQGQTLGSGSRDGTVRLWNLTNPAATPVILERHEASVLSLAFSPDGQRLASGSEDGTVRLWDLTDSTVAPVILPNHEANALSVAFSPDGQSLASGSDDGAVRLWDLADPADPVVLKGHEEQVNSVIFGPDEQSLVSGSDDGTVLLWNLTNLGADPVVLERGAFGATSLAFSPDKRALAIGSWDETVHLWNLVDRAADPVVLTGHDGRVTSVTFTPDGTSLVSGSVDGTIRLWHLTDLAASVKVLNGPDKPVDSVAFNPTGRRLAAGGWDGKVRLWDLTDLRTAPTVLEDPENGVTSVTFSPDGQMLASGTWNHTVRLWNLADPADPVVLEGHELTVTSVAFSPNGQRLASGSEDGTVRLWDVAHPAAAPAVLNGHGGQVTSVAFSPDGQTLASGSTDAIVRLWDLTDLAADPVVLVGHQDQVTSVAFSPDGSTLASGSWDSRVSLWDVTDPAAPPTILTGIENGVSSVIYSPDGQTLAAGSWDNTVRLWDLTVPTAAPKILIGHDTGVLTIAFSPDGQTLASGSEDGTVRLWIVHTEMLSDLVCSTVLRNLTLEEWHQFIGEETPYERTCPSLPAGDGAPA
jgi:WD40 repeat protein